MAVNRRLLKERLNLDPGLNGKTKPREKNHLKLFLKDSQNALKSKPRETLENSAVSGMTSPKVTLLNLGPFWDWGRAPRILVPVGQT
jgi:hypothetical protein